MTIKPIAGTFRVTGEGDSLTIQFDVATANGTPLGTVTTSVDAGRASNLMDHCITAQADYLKTLAPAGATKAQSVQGVLSNMNQADCDRWGL